MTAGSADFERALSRRDLLRLAAAGASAWILNGWPAAAQEPEADRTDQAEEQPWSPYAQWLHASWTTMAYPDRYDCDLPIWYMAMWAKESGTPLDWSWPNYFRRPVKSTITGEGTRDLQLRSWLVPTYEEFARKAQAYFGIKHLPVLVDRTGGRQLQGSALEIARGESPDRFWPGDIISSGGHAMVFIEPYRGPADYLIDYSRPRFLQQTLRCLEMNVARFPPEERAGIEAEARALRKRIGRHLDDLRAAEEWLGYHTPGNPWDPAIEEALARGEVPVFVPGRIVDSAGMDVPKGNWSQLFSGIVYPDLAEQPLPHLASASGRQMWEWFRPVPIGEECDWRCSTIVLRPFGSA